MTCHCQYQLPEDVAKRISRLVNSRTVAQDMIHSVLAKEEYVHDSWRLWRDEHVKATEALAEFGIHLTTYSKEQA